MSAAAVSVPAGGDAVSAQTAPDRAATSRWVSVVPPAGKYAHPVRKRLTADELSVVRRISARVSALPTGPATSAAVTWHIEPGLESAPLFLLQRRVLESLADTVGSPGIDASTGDVDIIAGRTQTYLRTEMASLGCEPGLARTSGVVLMGATVCGRRIILSNLTGYMFVDSPTQAITARLEARRAPALRSLPYRTIVRASGGLAHEYVHVWRAHSLGGEVRPDEPAWFAEGLAEFWAGVATVRALGPRHTYLAQHVLRARDYADWASACRAPLAEYRMSSPLSAGCEYHVGLLAVELLLARHSGLVDSARALGRAGDHDTFEGWFAATFGIGLGEFEREADAYVAAIRRLG